MPKSELMNQQTHTHILNFEIWFRSVFFRFYDTIFARLFSRAYFVETRKRYFCYIYCRPPVPPKNNIQHSIEFYLPESSIVRALWYEIKKKHFEMANKMLHTCVFTNIFTKPKMFNNYERRKMLFTIYNLYFIVHIKLCVLTTVNWYFSRLLVMVQMY